MTNEFIQQNFVTPEIAKALRELGFNEPCFGYYCLDWPEHCTDFEGDSTKTIQFGFYGGRFSNRQQQTNDHLNRGMVCTAPLWQQVIQWLRDKNIEVSALFNGKSGSGKRKYLAVVCVGTTRGIINPPAKSNHFYDQLDALKAAIDYAILYLKSQQPTT